MSARSRTRPPRTAGWAAQCAGAVLLGLVIASGEAPFALWWLAAPALALLTAWVAADTHRRRAVRTAWMAGTGFFAGAMFWIVEPFMVDAARDLWMAPFALVFLSLGMALFWAAAAWIAVRLRDGISGRAVAFAAALALADLARSYLLTGFPWALVGHVWIGTPVMQAAAFIGPVGLTLLTTLAAALPAVFWRSGSPGRIAAFLVPILVLGCVAGFGLWRLDLPDPAPRAIPDEAHGALKVRLVQPNATQADKWRPDKAQEFLDRQLGFTRALDGPPPDLVIWPETAIQSQLDYARPVLQEVSDAAGAAPVVLGLNRRVGERFFNSLAVIGPGGVPTDIYDKHHLVPFGEYMPLGDLAERLGIRGFAQRSGDGFSAGPGPAILDLGPFGRALPLICYEAVFPQDILSAPGRPDWILQITNDAWFGSISGPYQHLAQARLRSVETGLPLLRAANTGITAVIDARGRILASLPLDTAGYLDASLPGALPPTVYARTGDVPALAAILLILGLLAFPSRPTRAVRD